MVGAARGYDNRCYGGSLVKIAVAMGVRSDRELFPTDKNENS